MGSRRKDTKGGKPAKGARARGGARSREPRTPERREIRLDALRAIIERAALAPEERAQLIAAIETLAFVTHELERSGVTIAKLRKLIFGPSSEKTRDLLGAGAAGSAGEAAAGGASGGCGTEAKPGNADDEADERPASGAGDTKPDGEPTSEPTSEPTAGAGDTRGNGKKGHGRNGAAAYTGAEKVAVPHESLAHGDSCPECPKGKVYCLATPAVLVRVRGVAPLDAHVYERERLRCNLCGEVFTARSPPGVGEEKYDETAAAMIALLKYGCGLPFNRLERLGENLGIPLPAATQWEVVANAADDFEPVWAELLRQAAAGDVVYMDDTNMQVLSIAKEIEAELAAGQSERTGIFTSGVVSTVAGRKLAVFLTGREHAGENLAKLLAERPSDLPPPIQMCDATSRNTSPGDFETLLANCLVHARRNFVDVIDGFPDEVKRVLEALRDVYAHEATTRQDGMSPAQRLAYHQEHSAPLMHDLKAWLDALIAEKKVEPNSSLGGAIQYLDNHWEALTLFLRVPGAPLDNNLCERALKRVIVHRKNSLFFKTENGAHVGDMFLSLIHTAELGDVNPFDYLVAVQRHHEAVAANAEQWMPWNYAETLTRLRAANAPTT